MNLQHRIAAFMAEADPELASAIRILKECNIASGIYTDTYDLHTYKKLVEENNITTLGIEINKFNYEYHKDLAKFLNPKIAIYNWDGADFPDGFLKEYVDCSLEGNFIPTICPKGIKNDFKPRDNKLDVILEYSKRLHISLDPVEILLRYNIDVYTHYYLKYMPKISSVIIRDYKVGVGNRPVGYGSIQWDKIIKSFDKYNGSLILKPNLGTTYNGINNREQIFKSAFSCFLEMTCQSI